MDPDYPRRPPTRDRLVVPLIALTAYGLGLQRPFLDALPQDGPGQAFGLLGSGSITLQGVGPACFGSVTAGTGRLSDGQSFPVVIADHARDLETTSSPWKVHAP